MTFLKTLGSSLFHQVGYKNYHNGIMKHFNKHHLKKGKIKYIFTGHLHKPKISQVIDWILETKIGYWKHKRRSET